MSQQKIAIIGAGIGGIATANLMAEAGYEVDVYEKNSQPGGRAGTMSIDGFTFDTGPSWYLMPDVFEHYFGLFGLDVAVELDLIRLSPAYKVFFETAEPITITSDIDADALTFESIETGAGDKLRTYVAKGEEIYRLSLDHFLYSNFTSLTDLIKYDIIKNGAKMTRLAFTPIESYVSKYVSDIRLKQILEYPMVFLGTSPFSAPAIYSLMSALDFGEGVFYPKGGMYTIIKRLVALSDKLGVRYHYDTDVKQIMTQNSEVTGLRFSDDSVTRADIIISNADLHHTETNLLTAPDRSYPQSYWDKRQAGPSALLMYLGIKGELAELQHHNLLFVDDWKQNFEAIYDTQTIPDSASIYLCKPSASDDTVAPIDHENVFVLVPLPPNHPVSSDELDTLADMYLAQIERMTGVSDLTDRIVSRTLFGPDDFMTKFYAWQSTALGPSHVLSQSAFFRTPNVSKKVKGLYYVGGSTTPGIGLPMCLIGAQLVYKRLAGDRKGGKLAAIKVLTGDAE